ncbi:MAG: (Fe-S)-binding protein, partial [Alphaproteobacteria bacterium]
VDAFRPTVGFAAAVLLEQAGCLVSAPLEQTCCGQPAYNSGDRDNARAIMAQHIELFEPFDYVVVPSGSCAGMIRCHYPLLFANDPAMESRARALADKTWELVSFLVDQGGWDAELIDTEFPATVTYHDSCAGLRELGVREQPRRLLAGIDGIRVVEHEGADRCCGFGGTFCVKYADISTAMADAKIDAIEANGADFVVAGDLGCLLAIAGRLSRRASSVRVRHVAELLSGMTAGPAIGEPADKA